MVIAIIVCVASVGVSESALAQDAHPASQTTSTHWPSILDAPYPRAFFFRMAEGYATRPDWTYERWDATFSRLMGIEGKALNEELSNREARNIDFFTRFKHRHPDQLVLLHFNGNARDPFYRTENFFAGHWLYYNGTKVLSDLSADETESVIHVENPNLFMTNIGRFKDSNEDLGICLLDADGKPDWSHSEQLQLIAIDEAGHTLRVRRGCFGTHPMRFPAGGSYIAAHACTGPWRREDHLLWEYNHASTCPKDASGQTCNTVLAKDLADLFLPGGRLEALDGLELDALLHQCRAQRDKLPNRSEDCNADGLADGGIVAGINVYGAGVVHFCRQLRAQLGEDKLFLADGGFYSTQRACGILNGIESEGWPELRDHQIQHWSSGLNRLLFWRVNARPPVFNYINHRYTMPSDPPGIRSPDVPNSTHRLVQAVAQFTDAAFCSNFVPPQPDTNIMPGLWDELIKGTEKQLGWLGQPLRPAVRLAMQSPDLLQGKGEPITDDLLARCKGQKVRVEPEGSELKVTGTSGTPKVLRLTLNGVPVSGPDLFVWVTMRGEPMKNYPPETPRLTWLHLNEIPTGKARPRRPHRNKKNRTQASRKHMTWTNGQCFASGFYFAELKKKSVDLTFEVEGTEPIWISHISVHACPDVIYREFEHGLVLANPAPHAYTIDLQTLLPGQQFRRIRGSANQDPETNNGQAITGKVTLAPRDGLFLVRTATSP